MRGFLVGLALGITAGLLFAPASGEETRRELRGRLDERVSTGRRKWSEVLKKGRERGGSDTGRRAGEQAYDKLTEDIRPEERGA